MNHTQLIQLGMKVYQTGGDILLRMWYFRLNRDDKKTFEDFIDETIASLPTFFDPDNPEVNIMTPQMMEFAESVYLMFPMECSLDYHRHLANVLYFSKCPDCGLHIRGPRRRK